ncbi:MAG TPA: hypothetical protein VGH19_06530 [Verrucomicrobiae bacterium]
MSSSSVLVQVSTPPRGSGVQAAVTFAAKSMSLTTSWGVNPAEARITYVGTSGVPAPVTAGALMRIQLAGRIYWGICRTDNAVEGTNGRERTVQFVDMRHFLEKDTVFGMFNMTDIRMVGDVRVKRYWHILPADIKTGIKTFTTQPKSAAQIIYLLLTAPTVNSPWYNGVSPVVYHTDQITQPVFGINCESGKTLGSVLAEICRKQGMTFTVTSSDLNPYQLFFVRKGEGLFPVFPNGKIYPPDSSPRRDGFALTDNPTLARIVGGRNIYQVFNVAMQPDWNVQWQGFADFDNFVDDVYLRLATETDFGAGATFVGKGTRYRDILDDPSRPTTNQRLVGRQLARARALVMTVGEYAALREDVDFSDYRLFSGRSRMTMPVALYVSQLVFRAYRPPATMTWGGISRPLTSLTMAGKMLVAVAYDPATGRMEPDHEKPLEGNGYVLARGYQVGADLFEAVRPERFDLTRWRETQDVWQPVGMQVDSSGEDGDFILLDSPVIRSVDLVQAKNGHIVYKANPTITVAEIRATLCFEAERFFWEEGDGDAQVNHSEPGLFRECVVMNGAVTELAYADGRTASQKASLIAESLLNQDAIFRSGGFERPLVTGVTTLPLNPMYDRITITLDMSGLKETVDYTNQREPQNYELESDFDRRSMEKSLLPGQGELMETARKYEKIAAALRLDPFMRSEMKKSYPGNAPGNLGTTTTTSSVYVAGNHEETLPAGELAWVEEKAEDRANSTAGAIRDVRETQIPFGVVLREGEKTNRELRVQTGGEALVRLMVPQGEPGRMIASGAPVFAHYVPPSETVDGGGMVTLWEQGSISQEDWIIGRLMEDVALVPEYGETKLVRVWLEAPRKVPCFWAKLVELGEVFMRVQAVWDNKEYVVMKPPALWTTETNLAYSEALDTMLAEYTGKQTRMVTFPPASAERKQIIHPPYLTIEEGVFIQTLILVQRRDEVNNSEAVPAGYHGDDIDDWWYKSLEGVGGRGTYHPVNLVDANAHDRRWEFSHEEVVNS